MDIDSIIKSLRCNIYSGHMDLVKIIGENKLRTLLQTENTYKEQPLKKILISIANISTNNEHSMRVAANTISALKIIRGCHQKDRYEKWLENKINEACNSSIFENVSSQLGEIRALGALLAAFNDVEVIIESLEKKTTDFKINIQQKNIYIEVITKQMNEKEAKKITAFREEPLPKNVGHISTRIHPVFPAGENKKKDDGAFETTAENVASKFASLKEESKQIEEGGTSILWIDLQDEDWELVDADATFPICSWNGSLTTVGLWHAFYGKRGTPLFDQYYPWQGYSINIQYMRFPGKFYQNDNRFSAVALYFKDSLVLYDNPLSKNPLFKNFWIYAVDLPCFDYERSIIRWPSGKKSLKRKIAFQRKSLHDLSKVKSIF